MSHLIVNKNNIVFYVNNTILVYNSTNSNVIKVNIPSLEIPSNLSKNQEEALKNEKTLVINAAFSKCGKYFAICTTNKQLVIYNSKFEVIKNLTVARSTSRIKFSTSENIVIADKTGDVYLYKIFEDKCESEQLLGHLSMLLDVLVSECEKYIITCDRDEKIRVSHFPGSYNIINYCLGHEEYVSNLEFYNKNILVSSSGDGTIRFWNFLSGKQLKIINTNEYINDKNLIKKFVDYMDSETVEVSALPITNMKIQNYGEKSILVVSIFNFNGLQVYEVTCEVEAKLLQIIPINNLISFDLLDKLFILTNCTFEVYTFDENFKIINDCEIDIFYENHKHVFNEIKLENITVLYKRKYDNVQEYHERKKLRIENNKK